MEIAKYFFLFIAIQALSSFLYHSVILYQQIKLWNKERRHRLTVILQLRKKYLNGRTN